MDGGCGLVFGQLAGPWFHVNLKHSLTVSHGVHGACLHERVEPPGVQTSPGSTQQLRCFPKDISPGFLC